MKAITTKKIGDIKAEILNLPVYLGIKEKRAEELIDTIIRPAQKKDKLTEAFDILLAEADNLTKAEYLFCCFNVGKRIGKHQAFDSLLSDFLGK